MELVQDLPCIPPREADEPARGGVRLGVGSFQRTVREEVHESPSCTLDVDAVVAVREHMRGETPPGQTGDERAKSVEVTFLRHGEEGHGCFIAYRTSLILSSAMRSDIIARYGAAQASSGAFTRL